MGQNYPQLPEDVDKNFDHEKIYTGHLIFKPSLLRKTHCFSLFKIQYKIQSGHFLSIFINISGSQFELTGVKNPLSRVKKHWGTVFTIYLLFQAKKVEYFIRNFTQWCIYLLHNTKNFLKVIPHVKATFWTQKG